MADAGKALCRHLFFLTSAPPRPTRLVQNGGAGTGGGAGAGKGIGLLSNARVAAAGGGKFGKPGPIGVARGGAAEEEDDEELSLSELSRLGLEVSSWEVVALLASVPSGKGWIDKGGRGAGTGRDGGGWRGELGVGAAGEEGLDFPGLRRVGSYVRLLGRHIACVLRPRKGGGAGRVGGWGLAVELGLGQRGKGGGTCLG